MLRASLIACVVGLSLCGAGCDLGDVALGRDAIDDVRLADSVALHLVDAIEGGDDLTFADIFEQGNNLVFANAPDPTALLLRTNTSDDDRPLVARTPLSMMTYNLGLLDVSVLGATIVQTPDITSRRRALAGEVFNTGTDIIIVQELWQHQDVEEFVRRASINGYQSFVHDRSHGNDGLGIFVLDKCIAGGSSVDVDFASYASQVGYEYFPGPGVLRGWMSVAFVHPEIGGVRVFNTHLQSFPEHWIGRNKQARELGIIMRHRAEEKPDELQLVGGDFNASPYYSSATWARPDGSVSELWFHNTTTYSVLLTYGGLVDAAIMGRPASNAADDVTLGDTVINDADRALDIPGAEAGWCERTPHTTFTGSDCNGLYFAQYAGTEYPARLDHIFMNDQEGRAVVVDSRLVFTERKTFGSVQQREPSDHYGVHIDMRVARP